jgi:iron complex outermembrane receptor protein
MKAQKTLRRKELAATISLLLAASGGAALADDQDTQATDADDQAGEDSLIQEVVIVTGIRRSLQDSIATKMDESSIVEAVSAEEIGKLPDVSIAESLARLPGLTAQRLNGRGQVISVRGLSPDFTTALLNGRQQVSVGDNRGVEFDQYPSELLNQVVVYKTPDASLVGQGLAGTADMRTIRPLEYGERAIAANLRYEQNEYDALNAGSADSGERYSFSYVDQFKDNTVGLAIGFAHMTNPSQGERFNSWGYPTLDGLGPLGFTDQNESIIGGAKPFVRSSELQRDGIIGILEFEPNDRFRTAVDVYYSEFEETQWLRGIELPLAWGAWNADATRLNPGFTVDGGLVTDSEWTTVKGVVRNDVNFRDSELWSAGWNAVWTLDNDWEARFDISQSEVKRSDQLLETYSGTGGPGEGAVDTMTATQTGRGAIFSSQLDYTDPNLIRLVSSQGWGGDQVAGGQLGYLNFPKVKDELQQADLSFKKYMDGGAISSMEFGINLSTREKSNTQDEFFLALAGGATNIAIPSNAINGVTDLSFLGIPGMISFDPFRLIADGVFDLRENRHTDVTFKSWGVDEDVNIFYAQFGVDTMWGDTPVSGNFGVQVVDSDQFSTGFGSTGTGPNLQFVPVADGKSYTEVLPSLNLTFELTDESFVRFAVARTLARPRMDEMKASFAFNFDPSKVDNTDINNSPWSGDKGNPKLDPWIADAVDLSYERYFEGGIGYLSLAYFYKDLKSYVFQETVEADFTGFPTGPFTPVLNTGLVTSPQNGQGGNISGFEFSLSLDGTMLSQAMEGFGVIFNASLTDSSIQPNPGDPAQSLPGLSEKIANLTVYYENESFSARVNSRYRDDFLGEVAGFGAGREFRLVQAENVIDAQLSYTFDVGDSQMTALFQANNLSDEPFITANQSDPREIIDHQQYGRTYLLGLSYRY